MYITNQQPRLQDVTRSPGPTQASPAADDRDDHDDDDDALMVTSPQDCQTWFDS
jgi:hypothetical protein